MTRFEGKTALLTGVASGVGRATAIRLASEGASVYGLDVNADGMAETKATVEDAAGTMTTRLTDVRSVDECHAAVADCVSEFGGLDILGNIAGIAAQRHVHQVTEAEWDTMNDVNLKAVFFLSQAAIPHLLERSGNIVNIASNAGLMGQAYTVPYCATKGGVVNMTKAFAMEFVKQPLRVNAIAPGGIDTALVHNFEIQPDIDFDLMQPYTGHREMSSADQIAALFAFVASDEAGNIHGSILSADCGITAG
ncbi:MAG: SDR family oxidoreductase [Actinomycetota bacterium]